MEFPARSPFPPPPQLLSLGLSLSLSLSFFPKGGRGPPQSTPKLSYCIYKQGHNACIYASTCLSHNSHSLQACKGRSAQLEVGSSHGVRFLGALGPELYLPS